MKLRWRAVDDQGRMILGLHEPIAIDELALLLGRQGLTLLGVRPCYWQRTQKIRRRDLLHYFFHLEQLLQAGVPLLEALSDLRDSAENQTMRSAIAGQLNAIETGSSFSQALANQDFDPVQVSLIRAGEASGCLPEMLRQITAALKWQDELAAGVRQALTYPLFAGAVVLGALLFLLVQVVPQLAAFLHTLGAPLPWSTRMLIGVSSATLHYGPWLLGLTLLSSLALFWQIQTQAYRRWQCDRLLLRLPVLGSLLRAHLSARFAHALGLLYGAGIPVLDGLKLCERLSGNSVLLRAVQDAGCAIRGGQGLAGAFMQTDFFPPLVLRMLRVGERTGELDRALLNAAYFHERDVRERVARLQVLVEPTLTVILGSLLALIMFSVLGPVFAAMGTVR